MEINGTRVNFKRLYNPNRFNGLDASLAYIVAVVAFMALPALVSLCFKTQLAALYEYDVFAYMIVNTLFSQLLILLVAFVFSKIRRVNPFNGGGYFAKWDGLLMTMSALMIMGVMLTFYGAHISLGEDFDFAFGFGSFGGLDENYSNLFVLYAFVYYLISAILPAIVEEALFRGVIMRGLEQFGELFAVIASSVAFSLMHGSFSQMLLQFIGGLAIGTVVMLTKNRLIGSFMHFFNNAFAVVYAAVLEVPAETLIGQYIRATASGASIILGVTFLVISVTYFIGLYADKLKRKIEGRPLYGKFDKKTYYAYRCGDRERLADSREVPELRDKKQPDEREFSICGKYGKLNKKANSTVAYIVFAVGIALALISVFM